MKVLFATSEIYPHLKTGGLGDVSAALPEALLQKGAELRLLLPGYPQIMKALLRPKKIASLPRFFGTEQADLLLAELPGGIKTYVLYAPELYDRPGPYGDANGRDWVDNHLRFGAFCRVAADLGDYDAKWQPDIIHGNDWQCGLIPAYLQLRAAPRPVSILTIHNLAFQGLFPRTTMSDLGLPDDMFDVNGVEFYNQVGFLKAGLYYADRVTTVSPTYAREITTPEYGCGLDGLLRSRGAQVTGILNGIDQEQWNPETDNAVLQRYGAQTLESKFQNKLNLIAEVGLPAQAADDPLFAVVSRLTHQKGLDLLVEAAPALFREGMRLVVLGSGDSSVERAFSDLSSAYPGHCALHIGYNENLAHRVQAGADAMIVPSRFEPCGLVQLYALRYGTLPVVRATGGLADSVIDAGWDVIQTNATGFVFELATAPALGETVKRAMAAFRQPARWRQMQKNAMAQDFGWAGAADKYLALYESLRPRSARATTTRKSKSTTVKARDGSARK
ncbi:MAG TPA: glycogen synthase GlgA [Patescibacteria group bacterium]|nr:glycogen synthase GlgA [Patescibacteria group bacterium]